jgi:hypothetical protein
MKNLKQLEALQNAATISGLIVKERYNEDKRKTVPKFFFVDEFGNGVSPIMDYDVANHFILGWNNCIRFKNQKTNKTINTASQMANLLEWIITEIENTPDCLSDALLGLIKIKADKAIKKATE